MYWIPVKDNHPEQITMGLFHVDHINTSNTSKSKIAIEDFEFYKFLNFHCSGDYETTTYYTSSTTTDYYTSTSTSTTTSAPY